MTSSVEPQDTAGQPPARTLGQVFAAERERQGLSRADIAQRLHMSAYQVEAIETGDYTRLPGGTFLRGFVRNYAKIIGLVPDEVLPLLDESLPRQARPGIVVPTQNIRFDPLGERLSNPYVKAAVLAVVAVALAFAAMYWWVFIRPTPPGAAAKKSESPPVTTALVSAPEIVAKAPIVAAPVAPRAAEAPRVEPPARPESSRPEPAKEQAKKEEPKKAEAKKEEPKKAEAKKEEPKKAEAKKEEPARPLASGSVLKFRFKGESWVEIRDAKGRVLLSRLNAAGTEAEVSGKPPFNVIVGNAPEVELFYNDREFDLEPHTKVAVARFTIE